VKQSIRHWGRPLDFNQSFNASCSRRTHEECSLRNLTTQVSIFLWVFEELHDFLHFLFGTFLSGHILEGNT
jgi:hypothetical protein